jgi:peroxiredoxin
MSAGLVFVGVLTLVNLLLVLLVARRVRQLGDSPAGPGRLPWLAPGTRVPDFEALTVDGSRVSLDGLRGQRSLIGLFSTSCEPCREQAPVFARRVAGGTGPEQAFAVVVGPVEEAGEFLALLDGKLPVARETGHGPVVTAFSARAFPAIYLLDPDGRVIASGPSVAAVSGAQPGATPARQ